MNEVNEKIAKFISENKFTSPELYIVTGIDNTNTTIFGIYLSEEKARERIKELVKEDQTFTYTFRAGTMPVTINDDFDFVESFKNNILDMTYEYHVAFLDNACII